MTYKNELNNIINGMKCIVYYGESHFSYGRCDGGRNTPRKKFIDMFNKMGYVVETTIHAHGIGNNNENKIVKKVPMENGYMADCVIGYFHYTYSMYAKVCSFWFEDGNKKKVFASADLGIKCYSENE